MESEINLHREISARGGRAAASRMTPEARRERAKKAAMARWNPLRPPAAGSNKKGLTLEELRSTQREEILRLAAQRGARNVRVFGSVARD